MGKYAVFIWSSYAAGFVLLAGLVALTLVQLYRQHRLLRRLEAETNKRR